MLGAASIAGVDSQAKPPATANPEAGPRLSADGRKAAAEQLLSYFKTTAPQLLRPAEGILKYLSIAPSLPGKQYATSLWDWDTMWTARGLFRYAELTKDPAFKEKVVEHAIGSFQNFFDHQSDEGRIPVIIDIHQADPLGSLRKASPNINNQAKPVFAQLALMIAEQHGSVDWLAPYFDKLLRFHDSWVSGNQSAIGLLVWGDDVAIGNDNDPTTFGRPFFSSANLLLNCLFLEDLKAAGDLALRLNRGEDGRRLLSQARLLEDRIQQLCWDPRDSFFYTLDVQCVDRRRELIPNVKPGMDMSWHCGRTPRRPDKPRS
jgi:putative isomerase